MEHKTQTRLPSFEHRGWRFVSHRARSAQDAVRDQVYTYWLIDVCEVHGDAWLQEAYEVRYYSEDDHFELHAGPNYASFSAHFEQHDQDIFAELFEFAYVMYVETAQPLPTQN